MAIQRVGWRPYVSPALSASTLLTSIYGVWNAEQSYTVTSLNTSVYGAWNGENTLNDSLGNYNGTNNGVTYTTGKVGSNAFNFNGSSYFTLANDALKFTGNFSISAWVNLNLGASTAHSIVTSGIGTNSGYRLYVHSNGKIYFEYTRLNGQGDYIVGASTLVSNTWYHISIVNNGTSFNLYLNGEPEPTTGSTYQTILWSSAGTNISQIGKYAGLAWYMTGKMDALTVWNRSLSYAEVNALYNSGNGCQYSFPSSISGTISSYGDSVGTNHGTSPSGSAPAFTTGKIGKAFGFDGVNDYIILPNNSLPLSKMSLSSKGSVVGQYNTYTTPTIGSTTFDSAQDVMGVDYSISTWVYLTDVTSSQYVIASYDASGTGYQYGWGIYVGSGKIAQYENFGSSNNNVQATITANTWNHVVFVRKAPLKNGTDNGTIKVYINGTLIATTSPTTNNSIRLLQFPSLTTIGCQRWGAGNANYFLKNGSKIDALSVWDKQLTATEVTDLYNSGNGKQYPSY